MLYNDIKTSYILARNYVEKCCITVEQDGQTIVAFTEHDGKFRVTDWGGTSSALYLLKQVGDSGNPIIIDKIKQSRDWLINNQHEDGSWEAAEMQCCEATSAVVYDLLGADILASEAEEIKMAIKYIQSCYLPNTGAFISKPSINQTPHLYTTYLAVRALSCAKTSSFSQSQRNEIINWINKSKTTDENWGPTSQGLTGRVAHTVFALLILYYCGMPTKTIKKDYKNQIIWLKKQIKRCSDLNGAFDYEGIEVYMNANFDEYGKVANILKSYHFNTALLCTLFIKLHDWGVAQRIIKKMIKLRNMQDGWGISSDKIFVWATQQAIDCFFQFEKALYQKGSNIITYLRSIVYSVPYFYIKLIILISVTPMIVWMLSDKNEIVDRVIDILMGIIFLVLPWIFKRED